MTDEDKEKVRVKQRDWRANRTPEKIAADKEKNKLIKRQDRSCAPSEFVDWRTDPEQALDFWYSKGASKCKLKL
jgi:hypothetical protein